MGNNDSKRKSSTITPVDNKQSVDNNKVKKNSQHPKSPKPSTKRVTEIKNKTDTLKSVNIPLNSTAVLNNKEFLNDLSLFIVKAYETKFNGTFNEFMVNYYYNYSFKVFYYLLKQFSFFVN